MVIRTDWRGTTIPIGAAIIGVADAYDTLVTNRPYRRGRLVTEAIAELRRCEGTQFRADIVETLASLGNLDVGQDGSDPMRPGNWLMKPTTLRIRRRARPRR